MQHRDSGVLIGQLSRNVMFSANERRGTVPMVVRWKLVQLAAAMVGKLRQLQPGSCYIGKLVGGWRGGGVDGSRAAAATEDQYRMEYHMISELSGL